MAEEIEDEDDGDLVDPLSEGHLDRVCSETHVPRVSGFLSNRGLEAGSAAGARKANLSMMILIQRSSTAASTDFPLSEATAETMVMMTAVMLVDI